MKLLSIIIPHKNTSEFLFRLINTIPDIPEFEVIIIDDNSSESEKKKLLLYKFPGNVTLVFNNFSAGAGSARNSGLEIASGKWLLFADADDLFATNMKELIFSRIHSEEDIIYFGTHSVFNDTFETAYRHLRYINLINDFLSDNDKEDALRFYYTSPCSKMIRRKLIMDKKIRFEEIIASNDILFSIKSAWFAKKVAATNELLYIISVSYGTLTNTFNKDIFDTRFNAAIRANEFLRSIDKSKYQISILYYLAKSYKFGLGYFFHIFFKIIKHRSNILIGIEKIFKYKSVLLARENSKYLKT